MVPNVFGLSHFNATIFLPFFFFFFFIPIALIVFALLLVKKELDWLRPVCAK